MALTRYDEDTCGSCGHSMSEWDTTPSVEVLTATCPWCAAHEAWDRQHQDDRSDGIKTYAVSEDGPLLDGEVAPVFG